MALWLWYTRYTDSAIYRSVAAITIVLRGNVQGNNGVGKDSDVYIAGFMAMCV